MSQSIYEILRRYEFNKTEPETLVGLVEEALEKGESAREEQERLRKASAALLALLQEEGLILDTDLEGFQDALIGCAAGVDGSHQPVGGVGGKWYVPLSCALVTFEQGIQGGPEIEIESHIEVIQEEEFRSIRTLASERMLQVETKAIMRWAMRGKQSVLFIDGPIVDPPLCRDLDYIRYRCSAIQECLKHNIKVIGCAKRVRDVHFKKHLTSQIVQNESEKTKLNMFPSDLQLIAFVFAHCWRRSGESGKGIYTRPVDVSEATEVYKLYRENGLRIFSTFIQKSLGQYILRLDLPFLDNELPDESELLVQVTRAVQTTFAWTYPDQDIPLPIFIADAKCEIRKGCAEVLYEEIMTRTRTTEPIDQIVALQLEARL
ncbi:MAG: DNA double-strand break repair nuclease NurA [Candidatus Methanosuratincola sp.]